MPHNRRTFLAALGAAAIGTLSHGRQTSASWLVAVPPLPQTRADGVPGLRTRLDHRGVQLYTVRREAAGDLRGTLLRVAQTGYREVEFAGYFDHRPAQIRELLDGSGLDAPSAHVPFNALGAGWDRTLDDALIAGHRFVTVPWLPPEVRGRLDDWKRTAARFNRAAAAARAAGLRFAYHNHDFEFTTVDDVVPLHVLITETDPDLVSFELDVYWITRAGHDPISWLHRYPGRFSMLHLKDSGGPPQHVMRDVGAGTIDFAGILARAEQAGVSHAFVEHDEPGDAFASISASLQYLNRIRNPGG